MAERRYRAVVIAASTGGIRAIRTVLGAIDKNFPLPILVVQHTSPDTNNTLATALRSEWQLPRMTAVARQTVEGGGSTSLRPRTICWSSWGRASS